jgi:hypothetical protein
MQKASALRIFGKRRHSRDKPGKSLPQDEVFMSLLPLRVKISDLKVKIAN